MKTALRQRIFYVPIVLLIVGISCTNEQFEAYFLSALEKEIPGGCNLTDISYETTISPILQENCIACHNNNVASAGYNYEDPDLVLASAADGSLLGAIDNSPGFSSMPPGGSLDSCSIEQIKTWVEDLGQDSIPGDSIPNDPIPNDSIPDNEVVSNCDPDTVYFQNTILPLVVSSCATTGCHNQASHKDGVTLTDYASILRTGKIKAGDPGDSEFYESLTDKDDDRMPPRPKEALSSEQILLINQWILQGAKDNGCNDGCDTTGITFAATIWPMMQKFCTGCHSTVSPGGGITIASYGDLVALAGNGSLMAAIRSETGYSSMPPNKPLSDCNINLLQIWIDEGFPE